MSEESLFAAALALPASERAAFLNAHCPDPAVRKQVEALLDAAAASNPLDRRPAEVAGTDQTRSSPDHPHISKLLDAGTTDDGRPYFVMELVKCVPLTEYCDSHKLTIPARLGLFQRNRSRGKPATFKGFQRDERRERVENRRNFAPDANNHPGFQGFDPVNGDKDYAYVKQDKDLDPLRDRDDFKKLLADLEAKIPPPKDEKKPEPKK